MCHHDNMNDLADTYRVVTRLVQVRKARGLSAKALADRCATLGMPQLTVSVIANIESRRRDDLRLSEALTMCKALGVDLRDILAPGEMSITLAD